MEIRFQKYIYYINIKIAILYWQFYLHYRNDVAAKVFNNHNILSYMTLLLSNVQYLRLLVYRQKIFYVKLTQSILSIEAWLAPNVKKLKVLYIQLYICVPKKPYVKSLFQLLLQLCSNINKPMLSGNGDPLRKMGILYTATLMHASLSNDY